MIKVCYIQHASEHLFMLPIAKTLHEKDLEFYFVCKSVLEKSIYEKAGFISFNIAEAVFNNKSIFTEEEKEILDLKYGPPGIKEICESDVQLGSLFHNDYKMKENIVIGAIKFWENFFDKNTIDYLIVRETATFSTRTAYLVAKYRKIPMLCLFDSSPYSGYLYMNDVGEANVWRELIDSLGDENKILDQKEKNMVQDFIDRRIQRTSRMPLFFVPKSLFISIKNLIGFWIRDNSKNRKKDPIRIGALNYGRGRLWKKTKWAYFTKYFFKYDVLIKDEKYIYFPLFSPKETHYLCNDMYYGENEISLIKHVARCLPSGYFLYTKEHPFNPGDFTYSELKELKKSNNIKIFHPSISSQELIDNSSTIVTIEGTVGWEAFLSKKPLVCMGGSSYYSYSDLVYKVDNISNLSSVLWSAIKNGSKIYEERQEEWMWFIYKVISTCGLGSLSESGTPYLTKNEENLIKVADSLFRKITKNLNK